MLVLVSFSLIILIFVGTITYFLYRDVTTVMSQAISEAIAAQTETASIGANVVLKLQSLQLRNITTLASIVIVVTVIAGYIVARVVLMPTRRALEFQKQFIGNVAHELRTPLSIIKTNTEVRLMDADIPPDVQALHKDNLEELDRISEILNNLLSLSGSLRPERIEFQDIDLGTVAEIVMGKLRELADRKSLVITAKVSERRSVWGNASALEQIVTNILKNAVTYTPKGGHITLTIEPVHPDFMELTIRDSGVGIAQKDLFRIFEPYYRTDLSRSRARGGSGLGLTIVSELVKLHQGKITVQSVEGHGTSVMVLLPAGKKYLREKARGSRGREGMSEIAVDFSRHGNNHSNSS
ncbi:MAG: HAMP domain-containing histidine kinase [Patescibacteria group bacterium]|nr:HAMP domain-containing histidine kinase [Patescibacteria group bacterium]